MARALFAFLLVIFHVSTIAQHHIVVDKVRLTETVQNLSESEIPRVKDLMNDSNMVVKKINSFILDRFMLTSFDQPQAGFTWFGVTFDSEVKADILLIAFRGDYVGAYPNWVEEELFFDLETGDPLKNEEIPFHTLFTLEGYLDFFNRYWLNDAKIIFKDAIECAEAKPHCSYYDIGDYHVEGSAMAISLVHDCYPRAFQACSPHMDLSIAIDTLMPYLSELGKEILFKNNYTLKKGIDRFLYSRKVKEIIPGNVYLFGKVEGRYAFSMALNLSKRSNEVSGYYYNDANLQKIALKGTYDRSNITLQESTHSTVQGSFSLRLDPGYVSEGNSIIDLGGNNAYLTGAWRDPNASKMYNIEFTTFK